MTEINLLKKVQQDAINIIVDNERNRIIKLISNYFDIDVTSTTEWKELIKKIKTEQI